MKQSPFESLPGVPSTPPPSTEPKSSRPLPPWPVSPTSSYSSPPCTTSSRTPVCPGAPRAPRYPNQKGDREETSLRRDNYNSDGDFEMHDRDNHESELFRGIRRRLNFDDVDDDMQVESSRTAAAVDASSNYPILHLGISSPPTSPLRHDNHDCPIVTGLKPSPSTRRVPSPREKANNNSSK